MHKRNKNEIMSKEKKGCSTQFQIVTLWVFF